MYIKCKDRPNLFKNLNLMNVQNHENSTESYILLYESSRFDEKLEIFKSTKLWNLNGKSKNVPNHEN